MNAATELLDLYGRWLELTESEARAIRAASWSAVTELQAQKAGLQKLVEACSRRVSPLADSGRACAAELQRVIRDLVRREEENSAFLAQQLEAHRSERAVLEQSGLNLRRLRCSYGQGQNSTWQSYS